MASTKVRGITIELGADTSGLSKALKGVNSDIRSTEKQLKDVERLLKMDPSNTELLAQKQKLLGDRVSETKDKLEALKKAQEQVADELAKTGEGQEQYDALQREIIQTEADLKQAEQAAASFNATTAKISATADKMSQKFGTLAEKTKGLSMAAGGALVGIAGLAVKAGQDADELNTLAKQTGLTTAELQKMQYASDLIDVDTDTIVSGIRKLKKNLDGQEKTWKRLGVNVKDANGEYRDITDIFYDTVAALGEIENETERDTLAMDLFGKSADELAGIIDDGGAALKSLGKEAENMGVIISQEDLDKANELNDSLDKMKAEILPVIAQLGVEIAEAILPYLPQIKEAIDGIMNVLKDLDPQTVAIVGGILAVAAALSPVLSIISALTSGIGQLIQVLPKIPGALSAISTAASKIAPGLTSALSSISTFMTADIGATMAAGGAAAGGMAAAAIASSLIAGLAGLEIGKKVGAYIFPDDAELYESYSGLKGTVDMMKDLGLALKDFFIMQYEDTMQKVNLGLDVLKAAFNAFGTIVSALWSKAWTSMKETFFSVINSIKSAFTDMMNGIIDKLNTVSSKISSWTGGRVNFGSIKYMAEGGVLTSGTAIVGEAGPELVSVSNGDAMVQPLSGNNDLTGLLETYLPYLAAGTQLVLDSGALVGGIAPDMNAALGTISLRSGNR